MYEDILEPSKQDLKDKLKEIQEVLKESRDYINDQQIEIDVLKHHFAESFQDAKRYAHKIAEIYQRINENVLHGDFADLDIEGLVNEND